MKKLEKFRELRDVRKPAEKDAALKEWTTEKTLWNKFEGDGIDEKALCFTR